MTRLVALIVATDSRATAENKLRPRMLRCPVGDLPGSLALTGMTQRRTAESSGSSSEARRLRPHRGLENSSILESFRGRWTADGDGVCCHSPITSSSSSSFLRFLFSGAGELQRNEPTAISRARRTEVQFHHTHTLRTVILTVLKIAELQAGEGMCLTCCLQGLLGNFYSLNILVFFFHQSSNYADSERLLIHFKYILMVCYWKSFEINLASLILAKIRST